MGECKKRKQYIEEGYKLACPRCSAELCVKCAKETNMFCPFCHEKLKKKK